MLRIRSPATFRHFVHTHCKHHARLNLMHHNPSRLRYAGKNKRITSQCLSDHRRAR